MIGGLLDVVTRGPAGGLERDLRGRVDSEIRFDAGTRGAYSADAVVLVVEVLPPGRVRG
jgi:hypothetical protein